MVAGAVAMAETRELAGVTGVAASARAAGADKNGRECVTNASGVMSDQRPNDFFALRCQIGLTDDFPWAWRCYAERQINQAGVWRRRAVAYVARWSLTRMNGVSNEC